MDRHGPITACRIAYSEKLVLEYLSSEDGSSERERIERRYGRTNVLKLVAEYEEEQANKSWLAASTMACPGCEVYVEKSMGCNHVGGMEFIGRHAKYVDDMCEMRATLLLSVRDEDQWGGPVCALFYGGARVLQETV